MIEALSDYFLGTRTRREYANDRSFWKEMARNRKSIRDIIIGSRIEEGLYLTFGKIIPSIFSLGFISLSIGFKEPLFLYGAGISEGSRLGLGYVFKRIRNMSEERRLVMFKQVSERNAGTLEETFEILSEVEPK